MGKNIRHKKNLQHYLSLDYPINIQRMEDGLYCASIPLLKGCKGYGETPAEAIEELHGIKESLFELLLEQKKTIAEPSITLEIPLQNFHEYLIGKN